MIDDELFVSVKKLAAEKSSNVSAVVSDALRQFLSNRDRRSESLPFHIPVFDGGGVPTDSLPAAFDQLGKESELAPYQR